jgi:peroxiredoxin
LLASIALAGCDGAGAASPGANHPLLNNPAPDFTVDSVPADKGPIKLSAEKGKVVVLDFWGTFCDPCKESFPKLQSLNTKYHTQGLDIIGVSVDDADEADKIAPFVKTYGAEFAIGTDPDGKVAKQYTLGTMPFSFVIDRKGVVRYVHSGWHEGEPDELDKQIKGLIDEQ